MSSKPTRRGDTVRAAIASAVDVDPIEAEVEASNAALAPPISDDNQGAGAGLSPEDISRAKQCAPLDANDRDNGRRLLIWSGTDLLYVASGMGWHVWDGIRWVPDPGDLRVRSLALAIVDRIKLEPLWIDFSETQQAIVDAAAKLRDKPQGDLTAAEKRIIADADSAKEALQTVRSRRRQFAISTGNAARTEAMLKQAAALNNIAPEGLDRDQLRLNLRNGTLVFSKAPDDDCPDPDVRRFVGRVDLLPHSRQDLITKVAEVEYDPLATCPRWQAFLDLVQPDREYQTFLKVAHGYAALIGGNGEQRLLYHFGGGANGKSAFVETIGRLLGSYRAVTSPESFSGTGQRQGNQQNSDMARLFNARLVTVEELPRDQSINENLIKQLTGGSRFVARFLNRDFFEFDPVFTAVMTGNNLPKIDGQDDGIWRRLLIVPWRVQIPEKDRIPFGDLLEVFDQERAGILNWLIDGAVKWLGSGLAPYIPPSVREFTAKHRSDRDPLGNFMALFVVRDGESSVRAQTLMDAFSAYCEQNAIKPWHPATIGARLKELGYEKDTSKRHVQYTGIRLVDPPSRFDPAPPATSSGEWT